MRRRLLTLLAAVLVLPSILWGQAALAPPLVHQFFTSAGAVCNGCLLYSYAAGTTTPLATYTSDALSTPHANPIVLNSAGRIPTGGLFLQALAYKFALHTAADVNIWTLDNVRDTRLLATSSVAAVIQTTTVTGSNHNFALTDNVSLLRVNAGSAVTFTGFVAGDDGQVVDVVNIGAGALTIAYESASSTGANRIVGGGTLVVQTYAPTSGRFRMTYDATSTRWRVISSPSDVVYVTTTSTGTQNNFDPGINGNGGTTVIRCNNASQLNITGFPIGLLDGQTIVVQAVNSLVALLHNDSGSTYKLLNFAATGITGLQPANTGANQASATYRWDGSSLAWRMVSHEQGSWITPGFSAGNFTASAGNWTVDSGDITTQAYYLSGRSLSVIFEIVDTDVSATPATLSMVIPGGFTASKTARGVARLDDAATVTNGIALVSAAGTTIGFSEIGTAWQTTAADNTDVGGMMTFEVN